MTTSKKINVIQIVLSILVIVISVMLLVLSQFSWWIVAILVMQGYILVVNWKQYNAPTLL